MQVFYIISLFALLTSLGCGDNRVSSELAKSMYSGEFCSNGVCYSCPFKSAMRKCESGDCSQCELISSQDMPANDASVSSGDSGRRVGVGISVGGTGSRKASRSGGGCNFPTNYDEVHYQVDESLGEIESISDSPETDHRLRFTLFSDGTIGRDYIFTSKIDDIKKVGECILPSNNACRVYANVGGEVHVNGRCARRPQIFVPKDTKTKIYVNGKLTNP